MKLAIVVVFPSPNHPLGLQPSGRTSFISEHGEARYSPSGGGVSDEAKVSCDLISVSAGPSGLASPIRTMVSFSSHRDFIREPANQLTPVPSQSVFEFELFS